MTDTDQVFKEVANLLCEHMGVKLEKIRMDTSLLRDCGMAGDDADEFFQSLNEKYQIDWEGINLDLMFGSEGISIRFPWNIHKDRELIYKSQPCLVSDVVKAAKDRKWISKELERKPLIRIGLSYFISIAFYGFIFSFIIALIIESK